MTTKVNSIYDINCLYICLNRNILLLKDLFPPDDFIHIKSPGYRFSNHPLLTNYNNESEESRKILMKQFGHDVIPTLDFVGISNAQIS